VAFNILLLTHRVPYPPNRGDRIRSYHLLQFLAERANVSLACVSDEPVAGETMQQLSRLCHQIAIGRTSRIGRAVRSAWSLARGHSATEGYFWNADLARTVRNWIVGGKFDAVISYCSGMFHYAAPAFSAGVPVFVDLVDVDSQKWIDYASRASGPASWLYRIEGRRIERLERELGARCKAITVVSNVEASLLRRICPTASVHSISNGVDSDYFQPADGGAAPEPKTLDTTGRHECVFVGALDYGANVDGVTWFCRQVWPEVHRRFPQARFVMVGRNPVAQIRRLAAVPGVELAGEVPDVRPYLHRADLAVAPLRIARGIQNKVLEALSAGMPVIASPQAIAGLELIPGEHILAAETPDEWVTNIGTLFVHADERRRLGVAGREFACRRHRWDNCLQPWEGLLGLVKQMSTRQLTAALS
jgi:sugar transferase (PEP-CTERM/EpsH1 system associated)